MTLLACVIYLGADEFLRHPLPDPGEEPWQGGDLLDTRPVKAASLRPIVFSALASLSWGMPATATTGTQEALGAQAAAHR